MKRNKKFIQFTCVFHFTHWLSLRYLLLLECTWIFHFVVRCSVFGDFLIGIPRTHVHVYVCVCFFCSFIVHFYYHLRYESFLCLFSSFCLHAYLDFSFQSFVLLAGHSAESSFLHNLQRTHTFSVIRFRPPSKMKCFFFGSVVSCMAFTSF